MDLTELKYLIIAQIGIDITLALVFIYMIKRFRYLNKNQSFYRSVELFESLLSDADKVSGRFKGQLEEKNHIIQTLNKQLDNKISSLNMLLKQAEILLTREGGERPKGGMTSRKDQEMEILRLAHMGHDSGQIAHVLSIPKEEVRLVLDLKKRIQRLDGKEGKS